MLLDEQKDLLTSKPSLQQRDFETEWRLVSSRVLAFCKRSIMNQVEADEVFQRVAIRAWCGYAAFQRDATFLTWVLSIARREIARFKGQRYEDATRETSLELLNETTPDALPGTLAPDTSLTDHSWLGDVTRIAASHGYLTEVETAAILTRLLYPEENWHEIGTHLGLSGTTCSVLHCRAIPKLRVFLFTHRPDLLGGISAITEAFRQCCADKASLLSEQEIEAFRLIILQQRSGYRKAGWRLALRSACGKVIKWLPLP